MVELDGSEVGIASSRQGNEKECVCCVTLLGWKRGD